MASRIAVFKGKGQQCIQKGGLNLYEIAVFFKACLQVNGFVRPEKMPLPENALHPPLVQKRYLHIRSFRGVRTRCRLHAVTATSLRYSTRLIPTVIR